MTGRRAGPGRRPDSSRRARWRRAALLLCAFAPAALAPVPAGAHDVPDEVRIPVFVREADGELHLLARVPLLLLLSLNVPKWGAGYLDLERAVPVLREAGEAFAREAPLFHPDGSPLPPTLLAVRVALPWDRSFTSFDAALAAVNSDPLPADTQVFWNQGYLDVHLRYPAPESGSAAIECGVAPGFGDRVALDVVREARDPETGEVRSDFFHISRREGRVVLDPSRLQAARVFFRSGVEHILTGWDHLLFLLCLIAPFGRLSRLRSLLGIVTGFTAAHSITLVSAALGHAPSSPWFPPLVESVVALSIVYTAVENLISTSVWRRAALAFVFGLFHGFGFAFALGESLAFAGRHLPTALFSFNLGVEAGQAAVVLAVLPTLHLLGGSERGRFAVNAALSVAAGHAAWHLVPSRISELHRGWILAGGAPPSWAWLLWPLAALGVAGWGILLLRRRRAPGVREQR